MSSRRRRQSKPPSASGFRRGFLLSPASSSPAPSSAPPDPRTKQEQPGAKKNANNRCSTSPSDKKKKNGTSPATATPKKELTVNDAKYQLVQPSPSPLASDTTPSSTRSKGKMNTVRRRVADDCLLSLEQQHQQQQQQQHQHQLDPLDSSALSFNDNSSSNSNNPLFLVVDNESPSTDDPQKQQQQQQQRHDHQQRAAPPSNLLSVMKEVNNDNSSPLLLESSMAVALTPAYRNEEEEEEEDNTATIAQVQNHLAQILRRMRRRHRHSSQQERRHNNSATMAQSESASIPFIVDPWLSRFPRRLCWEAVLNAIAARETLSRRQPEVQLGLYMLQQQQQQHQLQNGDADDDNDTIAFRSLFRDAHQQYYDDKTTRRRLLAAANLLDLWMDCLTESLHDKGCEHDDNDSDDKEPSTTAIHFLVEEVIPLLAPLILITANPPATASPTNNPNRSSSSSSSKPTVLVQRTMDVLYRIFSLAAQHAAAVSSKQQQQSKPENDVAEVFAESVWRHSESVLVKLWKVQLQWLIQADNGDNQQGSNNDWNWSILSSKEIQRRCKVAVLIEWQQQFQFRCEQMGMVNVAEEGLNKSGAAKIKLEWCRCLAGMTRRHSSKDAPGSLAQTLSPSSSSMDLWSRDDLLEAFWESDDDFQSETTNSAARVRALVAWFGQKRKNLGLLLGQGGNDVLKLSGWLLESLASNSFLYCADISLVALRALWSMTGGLPPDVMAASAKVTGVQVVDLPKSFTLFVDILKSWSDPSVTDSTLLSSSVSVCVLCRLAVRCILALGVSGAESIVSRVGITRETVEILADILTQGDGSLNTANGLEKTVALSCRVLLEHFHTNSLVRARVHKCSDLFAYCSPDDVVPRILTTVCQAESDEQTDQHIDAPYTATEEGKLIQCLVQVLLRQKANDLPQTVCLFVQSLRNTIEGTNICSEKKKRLEHVCSVVGRSWRDALFSVTQAAISHTFGEVFVATARELLAQPSEQLHLNLFGAITGHESDFKGVNISQLGLYVVEILQLSLESMLDETRSTDIFHRIAPLLLLRRLPVSLLRLAMKQSFRSSSETLFSLVVSLGEQLSSRLDIRQANGTCAQPPSQFAPDERRLAAEVAGRFLPCGDLWMDDKRISIPKRCTCFMLLCEPAFSKLYEQLAGKSNGNIQQDVVRAARAALFVVSTAAQVANAEDEGTCLLRVARFAIGCLSVEPTSLAKSAMEDFVQLQAGCIEFFVVCQQLSFKQRPSTTARLQSGSVSLQSVANHVMEAVKIMLQTGKADADWMISSKDAVHEGKAQATSENVKLLARVSLWRSIVAASQRADPCEASMRHLPWIVAWLTDERENIFLDHSFCVTAAVQAVFVLLMRTKTFNFLAGSHSEQGKSVCGLYRFAIHVLQPSGAPLTERGSLEVCRSAALTLLLALVSINSITSQDFFAIDSGHLTPSDCLETFARVHELANNEEDPETKRISEQILSILRP